MPGSSDALNSHTIGDPRREEDLGHQEVGERVHGSFHTPTNPDRQVPRQPLMRPPQGAYVDVDLAIVCGVLC